jgi:integrase
MSSHLARRGGIWWARLVVPKPLRQAAGRREFSRSTKTHELHLAKLISAIFLTDWRRQILALEQHPMSSDILKLIGPATALGAGTHLRLSDAVDATGVTQIELLRVAASGKLALHCRVAQTPGYIVPIDGLEFASEPMGAAGGYVVPSPNQMPDDAIWGVISGLLAISKGESAALADAILTEHLSAIDVLAFDAPNSPGKFFVPDDSLRIDVGSLEVRADAVAAIQRHMRKNITPEQVDRAQQLQKASVQGSTASGGKQAHKLFSAALKAYATSPTGIPGDVESLTEQEQKHRGCSLFIELVGDLSLQEVTSDRLREFREQLKKLPSNVNHIPKKYRRESMAATVQALKDNGVDWGSMSKSAQRERLSWVNQMFRWLVAQEWLKENPVASVLAEKTQTASERKIEKQERARQVEEGEVDDSDDREPFSSAELRLIFNLTQYQTGNGSHFTKSESHWYPFQYWLPIIALHSGFRIKEVSQLYLRDIRQSEHGVWFFDINETTPDKSVKNDNAWRQVPVSPVLVELGLIAYRDRLEKEGYRRLFPELSHSTSDAKYAKESKRRMSAMFKELGMPRDGTKVFHCIRANFNDAMLRVPFSELPFDDADLKRFIRLKVMGHKIDGVNENHYSSTTLGEKLALVQGVQYALPKLTKFDIEFGVGRVRFAIGNKVGLRRGKEDMGPVL